MRPLQTVINGQKHGKNRYKNLLNYDFKMAANENALTQQNLSQELLVSYKMRFRATRSKTKFKKNIVGNPSLIVYADFRCTAYCIHKLACRHGILPECVSIAHGRFVSDRGRICGILKNQAVGVNLMTVFPQSVALFPQIGTFKDTLSLFNAFILCIVAVNRLTTKNCRSYKIAEKVKSSRWYPRLIK